MTPEDIDQSANGDGNTQIGGDGNIAGGDLTQIINNYQGMDEDQLKEALEKLLPDLLMAKLADLGIGPETKAVDTELDPEQEEQVDEVLEATEAAESSGIEFDPGEYITLGIAARLRGRTFPAERYFREALRLYLKVGDRRGEAASLNNLANIAQTRGDLDESERLHNESLAIDSDIGNRKGEANSLNNLGLIASDRGDLDEAERLHNESLAIERDIGYRQGEASSLNNLGLIASDRGDLDEAERLHNESLAIKREIGHRLGEAGSLCALGILKEKRGDLDEAERLQNESLVIEREIGHRQGESTVLHNLGIIARDRGDLDEAERLNKESLAIEREIGRRGYEAASLGALGLIAIDRGDLDEAERLYNESLAIEREIGYLEGEACSLCNLGSVAFKRGDYDKAERLYRESLRIDIKRGIPMDDWNVKYGYTDPDAPWDFPPSDRPPVPPAASKSVKQTAHGDGNIQIGGDANIQFGTKTPPAGYEYKITVGHDVKGTPTWNLTEVSDCIMKGLKKNGIDAATVKEAGGFWEDLWEESTEIRIVWPSSEDKGDGIKEACRAVCEQLDQDAILYTKIELSDIEFVERGEG